MAVNFYIDGFNLYHAIDALDDSRLKWLDHMALAKTMLRDGEEIGTVYFFTAVVTWDRKKQQRHTAYLKALRARGVEVVEGNFKKQPKFCFARGTTCKFQEEKKTDVEIASRVIADAASRLCTRGVLVTADSDQVPTVRTARDLNPDLELTLCYPPRRKREASELGEYFRGRNRKELKAGLLHRCLLPQDIEDDAGRKVTTRPAAYAPA